MSVTLLAVSVLLDPIAMVLIGALLSFGLELLPTWGRLDPKQKRLIYAVLCGLLPFLAALVGHYGLLQPFSAAVVLMAASAAFSGGTLAHTGKLTAKSAAGELGKLLIEMYEGALDGSIKANTAIDGQALGERMLRVTASTYINEK